MNTTILEFVAAGDAPELQTLIHSVRKLSTSRFSVPPGAEPKFGREDFSALSALGLSGMAIGEELGGSNLPPLEIAAVIFEIARAQIGPAIYLSVHNMVSRLVAQSASNDFLKSKISKLADGNSLGAFCLTEAEAGSDASNLKTKAVAQGSGYILNGEKIYITSGGYADEYLVFARTGAEAAKGISAFVVSKDTPGISFGAPEKKMGAEGSPISSVYFENCFVEAEALLGEKDKGYKVALSGLAGGRVNIAAAACGVSARAIELAAAHLASRKQFGKALQEFQGLQFMLADLVAALRASVLLTRDAAIELGLQRDHGLSASIAKCFATDSAMRITTDAVQLLGGAGYLAAYEVERLMRDAKMLQIVEGTNQIQRMLIARGFLSPAGIP